MLESEHQQIQHWLEIEDNLGKRIVVLQAATCTVGRDLTNSIVLNSKLVSRQHAILLRVTTPANERHFFRIIDGNLQGKPSANGITVNNQGCFSHDLKPADVIIFAGDVKATYYNSASSADLQVKASKSEMADVRSNSSTSALTAIAPNVEFISSSESVLIRLASFPELISNPILEVDLAGDITYLNPAAIAHFPNIKQTKLKHPILAEIISIVKEGDRKFFVREIEVEDRVFEQSVHYLAESDLVRIYVVDITKRKQTETALRESEAKNRALLNAIPDLMLRISKDGTYLDYMPAKDSDNSATCQMVGKNEYEVLPPEVAQQRMHYVKLALETSKPQIFEYKLPVNGTICEEEARIVVSGEDEVLAIVRDITERKQVEALLQKAYDELEIRVAQRTSQLSQANEQLRKEIAERQRVEEALRSSIATNRALLNAIPDSMFRISKDGTCVNHKAAKDNVLPVADGDVLGKNVNQLFPQEIAQPMLACIESALSTGEIQVFEYQLMLNDYLLDFEVRIAVSAEDEVMAIIRDITERKHAEADIRYALEKEKELGELKSRFITMASHEFRTPLTTILSSAELLQDYSNIWDEEKKLKHLLRIQASVKHMTGLLNDVLLIGKVEAGKLKFQPAPMNLIEFCREIVEEMQLAAGNHIVAFHCNEESISGCMDEKLLRQILGNLLSNAIKYSPHGGVVKLALSSKQQHAFFQVQDCGIGIPKADQAQLFDAFHRASNVGTISGTGLGLAIVKKSVGLHGGQIAVESEIGASTTFTVQLPLANVGF